MARFYFDLADGGYDPDRLGRELPDIATAQREAVRYAGEVLLHEPDLLLRHTVLRVEVTSDDGRHYFTVLVNAFNAPGSRPTLASRLK